MPDPWRWFARTFGIAVVAHLAGNPPSARSDDFAGSTALIVVSAVLGLLAVVLVARPDRRHARRHGRAGAGSRCGSRRRS